MIHLEVDGRTLEAGTLREAVERAARLAPLHREVIVIDERTGAILEHYFHGVSLVRLRVGSHPWQEVLDTWHVPQ